MSRHDLFGPPDIIGGRQVGDQCLFLLYIVIYYFKSTSLCFDFESYSMIYARPALNT